MTENSLGLSTASSSIPAARTRQMEIQHWFLSVEKRKSISLTHFAFEDEHVGYTASLCFHCHTPIADKSSRFQCWVTRDLTLEFGRTMLYASCHSARIAAISLTELVLQRGALTLEGVPLFLFTTLNLTEKENRH